VEGRTDRVTALQHEQAVCHPEDLLSSSATFSWDDAEGVSGGDWASFCAEHRITHSPSTVGGNVFYAGEVEFHFGKADYDSIEAPDYAEEIVVATHHFGRAMPDVARLARALWLTHGGRVSADPEIRTLFIREKEVQTLKDDVRKWALSQRNDSQTESGDVLSVTDTARKVLATIEFPGSVYLAHKDAQGLPAEVGDPRTPWVRGIVPGGELIVLGVPLGTVHEVRPESEGQYEMGSNSPAEWITSKTAVVLNLDLGALLSR
jgi:hypothetical protein